VGLEWSRATSRPGKAFGGAARARVCQIDSRAKTLSAIRVNLTTAPSPTTAKHGFFR